MNKQYQLQRFNQFKKLDDKFFFRVEYTISKGWFGDAEEIIKTCLHFAPTNIVSKYDISYEGMVKMKNIQLKYIQILIKKHYKSI